MGAVLISCSTGYVRHSIIGGFSERMVNDGIWEVSFRGNGYTRKEKAERFCMRRCAELTIEKGEGYFKIIDNKLSTEENTTAYTQYDKSSKGYKTSYETVSKPEALFIIQFVDKKEYDEMRKKYPMNYFKAETALELYPKE